MDVGLFRVMYADEVDKRAYQQGRADDLNGKVARGEHRNIGLCPEEIRVLELLAHESEHTNRR